MYLYIHVPKQILFNRILHNLVGKYTIHGCYGVCLSIIVMSPDLSLTIPEVPDVNNEA